MSSTREAVDEILTEMFGEERMKAIPADQSEFFAEIGAKSLDLLDFRCFIEEKFGLALNYSMFAACSRDDIVKFLETAQPSTNPY